VTILQMSVFYDYIENQIIPNGKRERETDQATS